MAVGEKGEKERWVERGRGRETPTQEGAGEGGAERARGDDKNEVGGGRGAAPRLRSRVGVGGEKLQIHRRAPLRRRSCG